MLTRDCLLGFPKKEIAQESTERCFIGADTSGHEYFVPVINRDDWDKWSQLPEDDEAGWETPGYATRIDGRFTFTDPRCE